MPPPSLAPTAEPQSPLPVSPNPLLLCLPVTLCGCPATSGRYLVPIKPAASDDQAFVPGAPPGVPLFDCLASPCQLSCLSLTFWLFLSLLSLSTEAPQEVSFPPITFTTYNTSDGQMPLSNPNFSLNCISVSTCLLGHLHLNALSCSSQLVNPSSRFSFTPGTTSIHQLPPDRHPEVVTEGFLSTAHKSASPPLSCSRSSGSPHFSPAYIWACDWLAPSCASSLFLAV